MKPLARILGVTVGLSAAGALCGALAGAAALTASLWLEHDPFAVSIGVVVGAILGAPLGALTAPILGWGFLRRVPLGPMFVQMSAGTTIGGVIGWITVAGDARVTSGLLGAVIGCLVAAARLQYRAHRLEAWRSALLK